MRDRIDRSRRAFLRGRFGPTDPVVRLPWSVGEEHFLEGCSRCEACIHACPEGIVVRGEGGFPEVDFREGGCTFCRACVEACPEPLFADPDSSPPWRHTAHVQAGCLAHQGVYCRSCQESCEAGAIGFTLAARRIPVPELVPDRCTGCGACVGVCPVQAITLS